MGFSALILAAGQGKRMHSPKPKVLHELCGRPMLSYVMDAAKASGASTIAVVVGPDHEAIRNAFPDPSITWVVQAEPLGTGDAVRSARKALQNGPDSVMVLCGDVPLLDGETLKAVVENFAHNDGAASIVTVDRADPSGYGRVVRNESGELQAIVEDADCSDDERMIAEVNTGTYLFRRDDLLEAIDHLDNTNAQGEFYLTDVPSFLLKIGKRVVLELAGEETEFLGVNTLIDLSDACSAMRWRILEGLMASGVTITDPSQTYVDYDVAIGPGTTLLPFTVIRAGVTVGAGCEVGPFTHLRAGTVLKDGAEVGNFTEVKASIVGEKTKAKHLSYLGDVTIGAGVNIGAGTIVANYDGKKKHKTDIADGAFIGSGTVLVAPVAVGKNATTGAGAVVTKGHDVAEGEVVVGVPAKPLDMAKKGQKA